MPSSPPTSPPHFSLSPSQASAPSLTASPPLLSPPPPSLPLFDPLSAYLDEQWHRLDLSSTNPLPPPTTSPPSSPCLHPLSAKALNMTTTLSTFQSDFSELERTLRSAISDADAADASRVQVASELLQASQMLEKERLKSERLAEWGKKLEKQVAILYSGMSELQRAREVEERIHALVVGDLEGEVRELKGRIEDLEKESGIVRRAFGKVALGVRKGGMGKIVEREKVIMKRISECGEWGDGKGGAGTEGNSTMVSGTEG